MASIIVGGSSYGFATTNLRTLSMTRNKRVCIIGLDGVGYSFARILVDNFALGGLEHLLNGYVDTPESIPPYTPIAWTTILAGVNPGKHGIFGFLNVKRVSGISRINTSYDVKYPRLFEMLGINKRKSVVANVPFTYPFDPIIMKKYITIITDWASPKQQIYPKELNQLLRQYLTPPPHQWYTSSNLEEYISKVNEFLDNRLWIYNYLLEKQEFDLYFIIFSELDWLMHRIPDLIDGRNLNKIERIAVKIDHFIRRAIKTCDLVVVVSDHNFSRKTVKFNITAYLKKNGLIFYKLGLIHDFNWGKLTGSRHEDALGDLTILLRGMRGLTVLAERTLASLGKNILDTWVMRKLVSIVKRAKMDKVIPLRPVLDPNRSVAWFPEPGSWGVYVKKGYLKIVAHILSRHSTIKKIIARNQIFFGPYASNSPDLIIVPHEKVLLTNEPYEKEPLTKISAANHAERSLLALQGDDIVSTPNPRMNQASLVDLVPTVLGYLDLPLPLFSDGRVLLEAFSDITNYNTKKDYYKIYKISRKFQEKQLHLTR